MIRGVHHLGEHLVSFFVPQTTAQVLEYRAFILSMDDNERFIRCAAEWAASFVEEPAEFTTAEGILAELRDIGEGSLTELIALCSAIAESAEIPQAVIGDLQKMLDLQNDIDPTWRPTPKCDCPRCRRPEIKENPPDAECLYDGISTLAMNLAHVAAGINDGAAQQPYYLTQVRAAVSRSTSRMYAKQREDREAEKAELEEWNEYRRSKGANV